MKKIFFGVSKIILSAVTIPLWFEKIFSSTVYLLDDTGKLYKTIFRHSMFDDVSDILHPAVVCAAVGISLVSVILNTVALGFSDNKKLRIISDIVFILDIVIFIFMFLLALIIPRGY